MTPEEARLKLLAILALLIGIVVEDVAGLPEETPGQGLGLLTIRDRRGAPLAVRVTVFDPPEALAASVQRAVRLAQTPDEGECGRGFHDGPRGTLAVQSAGYRALGGWV